MICCCSAAGVVLAAVEIGLTSLTSPEMNQFFSTANLVPWDLIDFQADIFTKNSI